MTMTQASVKESGTEIAPAIMLRLTGELETALRSHEERLLLALEPDDISMAVHRRSQKARDEVLAALSRVVSGTYGFCQSCQLPISEDRLMAIPHAARCANCAHRVGNDD